MSAKSIKKSSKRTYKSYTNLTKLHKLSDHDINYNVSPSTTPDFWADAEVFMPRHKFW